MRAMLTMLQIMSFDSWCSGIARKVCLKYTPSFIPPIFFVTYVLISGLIMANVVLAILLDNFLIASKEVRYEIEAQRMLLRQELNDRKSTKSEPGADQVLNKDMALDVAGEEALDILEKASDRQALAKLLATEWRLTSHLAHMEAKLLA